MRDAAREEKEEFWPNRLSNELTIGFQTGLVMGLTLGVALLICRARDVARTTRHARHVTHDTSRTTRHAHGAGNVNFTVGILMLR